MAKTWTRTEALKKVNDLMRRAKSTTFEGERANCISRAEKIKPEGVMLDWKRYKIIVPKTKPRGWFECTVVDVARASCDWTKARLECTLNFRDKPGWWIRRWNMFIGFVSDSYDPKKWAWCSHCAGCGASPSGLPSEACTRCMGTGRVLWANANCAELQHFQECYKEALYNCDKGFLRASFLYIDAEPIVNGRGEVFDGINPDEVDWSQVAPGYVK